MASDEKGFKYWVCVYYLTKSMRSLGKGIRYNRKESIKLMGVCLTLLFIYSLLVIFIFSGYWLWVILGIFIAAVLSVYSFFRKRKDRYWDENVLSGEAIDKKTDEAMQAFSLFADAEKEKALNLIKYYFGRGELFEKALKEALEFESLKRWSVLQEIRQELSSGV